MLLPYIILVRMHSLIYPQVYTTAETDSFLTEFIFDFLDNGFAQSIVACLLIFVQSVYINWISIKHRLLKEFTLLPGLCYILLVSLIPDFLILSPILMSNTFLIMAFSQISKTYKKPKASTHIYNTGLFIAFASLFFYPAAIFYFAGWIGLIIMRSFKRIDKLQFLSGLLTPYILLATWLFYTANLQNGLIADFSSSFRIFTSIQQIFSGNLLIVLAVFLISFFFVMNYNAFTLKKSIQAQKKIDTLYWIMLFCLVGLFFVENIPSSYILFLSFPFTIFATISFLSIKNKMIGELIHLVILTLIGLTQFGIILLL